MLKEQVIQQLLRLVEQLREAPEANDDMIILQDDGTIDIADLDFEASAITSANDDELFHGSLDDPSVAGSLMMRLRK